MIEVQNFPRVIDSTGQVSYGGSQRWYRRSLRRLAGCGPTCAANLAAFYQIGVRPDSFLDDSVPLYTKKQYVELMDHTWEYVKPGMRGFPWRDRFQEEFLRYAKDHGCSLHTGFLESWEDSEAPFSFVRGEIEAGRPLALLVLGHTEPSLDDETWHWMTITGLDPDERKLLISNYGKRQLLDADLVFSPAEGNDVHLISFQVRI